MDPLTPAITVLSAMITPVVIISACASLIISTASRGDRAIDRLYRWSAEFAALAAETPETPESRARRALLFEQIDQLTSRTRLLQRSLAACYVALGLFVATSVAIGVAAMAGLLALEWQRFALLPIGLGLLGAGALFYSCLLLVAEARLALKTTHGEMDFLWQQGKEYASADLLARREARRRSRLWRVAPRDETRGETRGETSDE